MFMAASTHAQKKVYWIHGFNDNETFWERYRTTITPDNKGEQINWYGSLPLQENAEKVNYTICGEGVSPSILIGHSAGGLVSRSVQKLNGNVKGIITVGTPNKGAGVADALNNNSLNNVAEEAIDKAEKSLQKGILAVSCSLPFVSGPIVSLLANTLGVTLIGATDCFADLGRSLANETIEDMKDHFLSLSATYDMVPSSSYLKTLNSSKCSVPIINIYGNENEKRLVRLASSFVNKDKAIDLSNINDKTYDSEYNRLYNTFVGLFIGFEALHYTGGTLTAVLGIFNPYYFAASALNFTAAASWTSTRRFVEYDVHNDWSQIIGAIHYDKKTYTTGILWWKKKHTKYVPVYEKHDGFIPNTSSMMDASMGTSVRNREVKGVNHLEMSSHPDMRILLNSILNNSKQNGYEEEFNMSL